MIVFMILTYFDYSKFNFARRFVMGSLRIQENNYIISVGGTKVKR